MRIYYFFICAFISLACANSDQDKASSEATSQKDTGTVSGDRQNVDSGKWTDNFLELKRSITTGDRDAVKAFIDFPIKSKSNEIWYLADSKLVMEIDPKEIKPFTESDFDKYFSSIFSQDLRKTFEKINIDEFFKKNKTTSEEIEVAKGSKSTLEASIDNSKHKIIFALVTNLTGQGNSKFTTYYQFDVLNDQNIKFREVHVE
jgi:hypothetical protein